MSSFVVSLGIIFAAELGDKSQLMALAFAARAGMRAANLVAHSSSKMTIPVAGASALAEGAVRV